MKPSCFSEVRAATIEKLREVRECGQDKSDSLVYIENKQEPIPRTLILDPSISAGAVRAYGVLTSHCPTPFPGMRRLAQFLGGNDGSVRTTDELFLSGWITKEIIREPEKKQSIGTVYFCFSRKYTPEEMAGMGVGWVEFVARLANTHARQKAGLRRKARKLIRAHPGMFEGVFVFSESVNTESVNTNERSSPKEGSQKKKILSKETGGEAAAKEDAPAAPKRLSCASEFGFEWSPSWSRFLAETQAVAMLRHEGIAGTDSARRIVAEWSASMARQPDGDPAAALIWICRNRAELAHTAAGDERLPAWA